MSNRKKHPTPKLQEDQIAYYPLPDLLPAGQALAFNARLGLLSHLATSEEGRPRLLMQEQFTSLEARVLLPLLDAHPDYCPHEVLYASLYYGGTLGEQAVERARERLHEAMEAGIFDYEMRAVRNVVSRMRVKLRAFGIDVRSILETGYLLKPLSLGGANDQSGEIQNRWN